MGVTVVVALEWWVKSVPEPADGVAGKVVDVADDVVMMLVASAVMAVVAVPVAVEAVEVVVVTCI